MNKAPHSTVASLRHTVSNASVVARNWLTSRKPHSSLARMSERELADVGLTRHDLGLASEIDARYVREMIGRRYSL